MIGKNGNYTTEQYQGKNGTGGARNVFTQHGKRTKVGQRELNVLSMGGAFSSGKGLSVDTSQNMTAKRLGGSTEAYNSIANNIN